MTELTITHDLELKKDKMNAFEVNKKPPGRRSLVYFT
jgi:hypothetical protein